MIIQLDGPATADTEAAQRSLGDLAHGWGYEIVAASAGASAAASHGEDGKVIDPASVAAVAGAVLSIPSAALAVLDLADRIRKRRRATELIDQARQLAAEQVTIRIISQGRAVELRSLDPDQLLDLVADDD